MENVGSIDWVSPLIDPELEWLQDNMKNGLKLLANKFIPLSGNNSEQTILDSVWGPVKAAMSGTAVKVTENIRSCSAEETMQRFQTNQVFLRCIMMIWNYYARRPVGMMMEKVRQRRWRKVDSKAQKC
jgi:hypothetical protein